MIKRHNHRWTIFILSLFCTSNIYESSSFSINYKSHNHNINNIQKPLSRASYLPSTQHCRHVTSTTKLHESENNINNGELAIEEGINGNDIIEPKLYDQRWVQLAYLSLLALLSDWICFAVAAVPATYESAYAGHTSASLIDLFLFTNVASCFIVTDVVNRFGLKNSIQFGAVLMTVGCLLRSGVQFLVSDWSTFFGGAGVANAMDVASSVSSPELVPYWAMVAGTVLVGFSQPFFQCTPPLLSAKWFGSDERATSTAVALNFNQIGIATAFLVGGTMATSVMGLGQYLTLTTVICAAITIGTILQFQEKPPSPPSTSEIDKMKIGEEEEPPFFESVKSLFATDGFSMPVIAFICSISITNIVGAFIDEVMERGGITNQFDIDLAGAGFEFAILFGGIIIGGYVDRTKEYKKVTMACLIASIFLCIPLGLTDHALGQEPILLIASLLGLGIVVGPVQPINAELAVDVTYPSDETAVESVQQIGGNLFSALIIPVAEWAARQDYTFLKGNSAFESDIRGDVIVLSIIALSSAAYYSRFEAPLMRSLADCGDDGSCELPTINLYCGVDDEQCELDDFEMDEIMQKVEQNKS